MTDLTKIEKPFGLLKKKKQNALRAYDGQIEFYGTNGWDVTTPPIFFPALTYRAKPLTLPAWPPGLDPKWKWITMDKNGWIYVYEGKPIIIDDAFWVSIGSFFKINDLFENLSFDGIPWQQAIIQRPEGV